MDSNVNIMWPRKFPIIGINVSVTNYEQAVDTVIEAVRKRVSAGVTHLAVRGLIEAIKTKDSDQHSILLISQRLTDNPLDFL